VERLTSNRGVDQQAAQMILGEIGVDITRFPSAAHLATWLGICLGNDESAGKRRSGKPRKRSPGSRAALIEAAHAAARTEQTFLAAQFRRLAAWR
jgi:transposase